MLLMLAFIGGMLFQHFVFHKIVDLCDKVSNLLK